MTVLPLTIEASGHAGHDGAGKIPRRNYRPYAQRNVHQGVAFARHLHRQFGTREAQRLPRVVLAEVDSFGDIGVGLGPVLADFENQPGAEFEFALAHYVSHAEEQAGALFKRRPAPAGKGCERRLHGGFHVLLAGFLVQADQLRGPGGIDGLDLVAGPGPLAADDQVVLAAQLAAHFFDGGAHLAGSRFLREIGERFVYERPFMQACLWAGRSFNGCHERTSEIFDAGGWM